MLGTGEYTTGFTGQGASDSDKSTGVVALVMLDLRRRGKVGKLGMCGTNGAKMPAIRAHMQRVLGVYAGIDPSRVETWPADDVVDPKAYLAACEAFEPGDVAIIFTPDDTHFAIAKACLARGMHVLITKPPVKTLEEHIAIARAAKARAASLQDLRLSYNRFGRTGALAIGRLLAQNNTITSLDVSFFNLTGSTQSTIKTRYLVGSHQVVRVDEENIFQFKFFFCSFIKKSLFS